MIASIPTLVCRPALPMDTPAVMELASRIWEGHDYLPSVWADWMADPNGLLVVAEYKGHIVGTAKLTQLLEDEFWLEGFRIHPDYQGFGFASHVHGYMLDHWLRTGRGMIRLTTLSTNYAVHHLCEKHGFRRVAEFTEFRMKDLPELDDHDRFQALNDTDVSEAVAFARQCSSQSLTAPFIDLGWKFVPYSTRYLAEAAREGRAWWWRDRLGLFTIWIDEETEQPGAMLQLAACQAQDLPELVKDFQSQARHLGYTWVGWVASLQAELQPILEQTGFRREWDGSVYLFERGHPYLSEENMTIV